jgi:membrane-associated protease RseP (regulator of RpoE activity)
LHATTFYSILVFGGQVAGLPEAQDTLLILHYTALALTFIALILGLVAIFSRIRYCYLPVIILFGAAAIFYLYTMVAGIVAKREAQYIVHYLVVGLDSLVLVILFCMLYRDDKPSTSDTIQEEA